MVGHVSPRKTSNKDADDVRHHDELLRLRNEQDREHLDAMLAILRRHHVAEYNPGDGSRIVFDRTAHLPAAVPARKEPHPPPHDADEEF